MRVLFILLLSATLSACAVNPLAKKEVSNPAHDETIATDAVGQLVKLYPPAKTQFNVIESEPAEFGELLAEKLRVKGYAVAESRRKPTGIQGLFQNEGFGASYPPKPAQAIEEPTQESAKRASGIEVRYVLVHSSTTDFSRIALKIGNSLLARAYLSDNGNLAPAGAWTFKE